MLSAHDGVVRHADLVRAGVSSGWLRRRLDDGSLVEPFPGVVSRDTDAGSRLLAAQVFGGAGARLSHVTAAHVLGLRRTHRDDPIHVAVPHGRKRRSVPGLTVHQCMHAGEVRIGPLRVVPLPQTLLDLVPALGLDEVRFLATEAIRRGRVTAAALRSDVRPHRHSAGDWGALLQELDAGALSGGEARYWRAVADAGLPLPELNAPVAAGRSTYYVDALWRDYGLGAEIDGFRVHGHAAAFDADRARQNALQSANIVLIRFPVAQVMREPRAVAEQTRTALQVRAHELRLHRRLRLQLTATVEKGS